MEKEIECPTAGSVSPHTAGLAASLERVYWSWPLEGTVQATCLPDIINELQGLDGRSAKSYLECRRRAWKQRRGLERWGRRRVLQEPASGPQHHKIPIHSNPRLPHEQLALSPRQPQSNSPIMSTQARERARPYAGPQEGGIYILRHSESPDALHVPTYAERVRERRAQGSQKVQRVR